MRNSFSLSVYFVQVIQCHVEIVLKITASRKMKLIPLTILTISLAVDLKAHEHFTFPPQFQTPHAGVFSTDNSHYLPPESHTTIPLFPMRNVNSLPYQYLPPTGKKAPMGFPSPFPMMVSSTMMPSLDGDDDDDDDENNKRTPSGPPLFRNQINSTSGNPSRQVTEKKEARSFPRPQNYQHNIDRIDTKLPYQFNANPQSPSSTMQSPPARNLIISAETHRNDRNIDQIKAGGYPQYLPSQGVSFISSTTEPAIPILRLSNEMDLDGSFSYEALGADQTHYVQHSHMENMGTDKEEQVVEGSYSYVGDNGQTYTVHYIADSNGFRASGDHLPVAPPIPEIIQRAVQYNLAEEARKPPHLKSWQSEEKENELSESEKSHRFAISPPRNLFTGKTPESFSYAFSQGSNTQNNLVAAASSQAPIKTNIEFPPDQMKGITNSGTISPQITFLASQGAHVPSINTAPQTIARMFSTEKPTMPQLMNYEAGMKESEQDTNKALWRWQYGLNANLNQILDKNTISRSFGEGDDVMINFSDMSPEQYTKIIKSEIEPSGKEHVETYQRNDNSNVKQTQYYNSNPAQALQTNMINEYQTQHPQYQHSIPKNYTQILFTESTITPNYSKDSYLTSNSYAKQNNFDNHESVSNSRSNLITHHEFVPPSQTVTQSYDYEDSSYEPRRIKISNTDSITHTETNIDDLKVIPLNNNGQEPLSRDYTTPNNLGNKSKNQIHVTNIPPYVGSTINSFKFTDFIVSDNKNQFKPLINTQENDQHTESTTTTEKSLDDSLRENIFLKNIFNGEDNEQSNFEKLGESEQNSFEKLRDDEPSIYEKKQEKEKHAYTNKINSENKIDKSPKYIQYQPKPHNGLNGIQPKPVDISELLNYMTIKNHFESSKIRPKSNINFNNLNRKTEARYIPVNQDNNDEDYEEIREQAPYKPTNHQQQQELRGIIKNYKVLHRNNSQLNVDHHDSNKPLKRNLSPPPLKMLQTSNLPPLGRAGPSMKSYLPPIYV